ncbi:MAG: HEAT repeat domain-containing protein [Candidatus Poribacteria bacterium]
MTSLTNPEAIKAVKDAMPALIQALQDPDEDVRAYAAVLGQIRRRRSGGRACPAC